MCWSTYVIVGLRRLHCIKLILSVRVIIIILCLLIKVDRWNHAGHQLIMLALFSEHNNYWYKRRLADTVNPQCAHLVCHCMRAQMQSCNVSKLFLLHLNGLWSQCWADKTIKGKMWLQKAINFHFSLLEGKQSSAKLLLITWPLGTREKHDS